MGNCFGNDSAPPESAGSIASSNKESTTKSIGLSSATDDKKDNKHSRRGTSTKGMTRLVMKFPLIRRSFKACRKVFDSCAGDKEYITKSQVKPLLIQLGAESSVLSDDEIDRIIKTANLDGDDKIDFKEFLIAAAVGCFLNDSFHSDNKAFMKNKKGFEVAREAFDNIDKDKSGEIDFDELKDAFLSMKQDDLITERLKELDFNGDKTIEFPEFVWGITAWVGMDPDAEEDDINENDFDFDNNTQQNVGNALSPKHILNVNKDDFKEEENENANNPTDENENE